MQNFQWGAGLKTWLHFASDLALSEDLLPVVSNPHARISPDSKLQALGKTPSLYNYRGEATGVKEWTQKQTTMEEVAEWSANPDYGLCLQTRRIRALDIDVDDPELADEIEGFLSDRLGRLPMRFRRNSGKCLLAFHMPGDFGKRVLAFKGGIVEFLATGQQFIVAGAHHGKNGPSGAHYEWFDGLPESFPTIEPAQFEATFTALRDYLGGEFRGRDSSPRRMLDVAPPGADEVARWLVDNGWAFSVGPAEEVYIRCPFEDEHTSDSGETATVYFPAGGRGYERGHFKCLHAHCADRLDEDFLKATGYRGSGFAALPAKAPAPLSATPTAPSSAKALERGSPAPFDLIHGTDPRTLGEASMQDVHLAAQAALTAGLPPLERNDNGKIIPTLNQVLMVLERPDVTGFALRVDSFLDCLSFATCERGEGVVFDEEAAQWQSFRDVHYTALRSWFEGLGFLPISNEMMRDSVHYMAEKNRFDSAQVWLDRQVWDGVPRIAEFLPRYLKSDDDAYTRAVSLYWWTALAGRIISPGCQADMMPILRSPEGKRKSSAIKACAPSPALFAELSFLNDDDKNARIMRGKLVCEFAELKGLLGRDNESIKAFITKRVEEWVPKFKEFATQFPRRCLFIGSANPKDILPQGERNRRFLPFEAGVHGVIDTDKIAADRDQLWAEGAAMFRIGGVSFRDAEILGEEVVKLYAATDDWETSITDWMGYEAFDGSGQKNHEKPFLRSLDIFREALAITSPSRLTHRDSLRLGKIMRGLGYEMQTVRIGEANGKAWRKVA